MSTKGRKTTIKRHKSATRRRKTKKVPPLPTLSWYFSLGDWYCWYRVDYSHVFCLRLVHESTWLLLSTQELGMAHFNSTFRQVTNDLVSFTKSLRWMKWDYFDFIVIYSKKINWIGRHSVQSEHILSLFITIFIFSPSNPFWFFSLCLFRVGSWSVGELLRRVRTSNKVGNLYSHNICLASSSVKNNINVTVTSCSQHFSGHRPGILSILKLQSSSRR